MIGDADMLARARACKIPLIPRDDRPMWDRTCDNKSSDLFFKLIALSKAMRRVTRYD